MYLSAKSDRLDLKQRVGAIVLLEMDLSMKEPSQLNSTDISRGCSQQVQCPYMLSLM